MTNVSNPDGCAASNLSGDIAGTNVVIINPRPTATLLSTNSPGRFAVTNCDLGTPYTFTNRLTGIGPWTVSWDDGFVQTNLSVGPGPTNLTRTVVPTNAFGANLPSTNVYYVTNVSNPDGCVATNLSGDIIGTNMVTINPRPTATLISTNFLGLFAATNCDLLTPYGITNVLNGIGPWVVRWNDGFVQTNSNVGPGPTNLTRTVVPTNIFGANQPSTNVYYVTNVSNPDGCVATNFSGDITGTNIVTINPRPTSRLVSLSRTNCSDVTVYGLTNILTGVGPWIVNWSDGHVQTNMDAPFGPVTNSYTVFLTNSLPSAQTNFAYSITNLTDANCASTHPGDLIGTNKFTINPIPTALLSITNGDFAARDAAGDNLLVGVTNTFGTSFDVRTIWTYTTNMIICTKECNNPDLSKRKFMTNTITVTVSNATLYVTNHANLTGIGPWAVTWREVSSDPTGAIMNTNSFTTNYPSSSRNNAIYVWSVTIHRATPGTNFTFDITSLTDTNSGCMAEAANLTNSFHVTVNGGLTADVNVVGPNTICNGSGTPVQIQVDLGGLPPWTNAWSDGVVQITNSTPLIRFVSPTNFIANIATNYFYSVTNLSDRNSSTSDTTNDLLGVAVVTVDPVPTNPPVSLGVQTNCFDVAVQLLVSVPTNFTADWFDSNTNALPNGSGTTNFVYLPTNSVSIFGTNTSVTNVYLAASRFDDVNANCASTNLTTVLLVLQRCTNQLSVSRAGTNALIQWYGNYVLQTNTDLSTTNWGTVTQGLPGASFIWTNSTAPPPANNFFRLFAPTNLP